MVSQGTQSRGALTTLPTGGATVAAGWATNAQFPYSDSPPGGLGAAGGNQLVSPVVGLYQKVLLRAGSRCCCHGGGGGLLAGLVARS